VLQVIAQRIRWSQGLQAPTTTSNAPETSGPLATTTVADLLEFHCPKSGLTPLMAAVVKGHLAMSRQARHLYCACLSCMAEVVQQAFVQPLLEGIK